MSPPSPHRINAAELREVALPFREPFRTAAGAHAERRLLLVRLESDGATGWGECGPIPGYSVDTLDGARRHLGTALPMLVGTPLGDPGLTVGHLPRGTPPTARFAVDSAALDLVSRLRGIPARHLLGGEDEAIPIGAVIGIGPPEVVVAAARAAADDDFARIKLKAAGPIDLDTLRAVRKALPDAVLAVDGNGAFTADHLPLLAGLDDLHLAFIEQPFPAQDLATSARLAAAAATPVCLDESITTPDTVRHALAAGAGSIINLKPARFGGFAAALDALDLARAAGAGTWIGGMLESGIGRAAALALAAVPGTTHAADLAPPDRLLGADLVATRWIVCDGGISRPTGPGLGFEIDLDALQRATINVERAEEARSPS